MTDLNSVLQRTQDHLRATLGGVSPQITEWLVLITKEKVPRFENCNSICLISSTTTSRSSTP